MEAKYSSSKLVEMVEQLKKDHYIISNLKNEKVLYLGIMNADMQDYNFINLNLNFDCVIMLIKKYIFYGRDVRKFYDWGLIQRVTKIEGEITEIKKDISEIKKDISEIKNEISVLKSGLDDLKTKLDLIIKKMGVKRETLRKVKKKEAKIFTEQKRKRDKEDNNDSSDS